MMIKRRPEYDDRSDKTALGDNHRGGYEKAALDDHYHEQCKNTNLKNENTDYEI